MKQSANTRILLYHQTQNNNRESAAPNGTASHPEGPWRTEYTVNLRSNNAVFVKQNLKSIHTGHFGKIPLLKGIYPARTD